MPLEPPDIPVNEGFRDLVECAVDGRVKEDLVGSDVCGWGKSWLLVAVVVLLCCFMPGPWFPSRRSRDATSKGPGAIVFILWSTLPPPFPLGLSGANNGLGSACIRTYSVCVDRDCFASRSLVGVALLDFEVGNGGNAQSRLDSSGDGGPRGKGAVALLGGIRRLVLCADNGMLGETLEILLGVGGAGSKKGRSEVVSDG